MASQLPCYGSWFTFSAVIAQRLIVIADAHLAAPAPKGGCDEEALLDFLHSVPQPGDALFLAGDIYDFWFAWRHVVPRRNFALTAALAELGRKLPILMIGGNHDRWGDTFWDSLPGVTFATEQIRFEAADRRILGIHGDGLHEHRGIDRLLNRLIRSPLAIGAYRLIPPDLAIPIGQSLGHDGNGTHPDRADIAASRQREWALHTMTRDPTIDLLVMGHTHLPACEELAPGRWYLNPGPWLREHRYALVTSESIQAQQFS